MKIMQNSGEPIYQQIASRFKEDILTGKLEGGNYLPSIRGLAKELKISVITTMKAYETLEAEGLVTAVQGKGYYVNPRNTEMLREQHMRKTEDLLNAAIESAEIAGLTDSELRQMFDTLLKLKNEND